MSYVRFAVIFFFILTGSLKAAPVAVVEAINAADSGISLFDFLEPGDSIELGSSGDITLSYLTSCTTESIKGGSVTIGENQSQTVSAEISRTVSSCDGGGLLLTANQSVQSGAIATRDVDDTCKMDDDLTIFSTRPLLLFKSQKVNKVKFIRLCVDEPAFREKVSDASKSMLDMMHTKSELVPGARYMIDIRGKVLIVKVDEKANADNTQPINRIIPF